MSIFYFSCYCGNDLFRVLGFLTVNTGGHQLAYLNQEWLYFRRQLEQVSKAKRVQRTLMSIPRVARVLRRIYRSK